MICKSSKYNKSSTPNFSRAWWMVLKARFQSKLKLFLYIIKKDKMSLGFMDIETKELDIET